MAAANHDLARRAVACKGWRWMPGMRVIRTSPGRIQALRCEADDEPDVDEAQRGWTPAMAEPPLPGFGSWLPDLDDPATLGCLLALVREAWRDHLLDTEEYTTAFGNLRTCVRIQVDESECEEFLGTNLAEALVGALEDPRASGKAVPQ